MSSSQEVSYAVPNSTFKFEIIVCVPGTYAPETMLPNRFVLLEPPRGNSRIAKSEVDRVPIITPPSATLTSLRCSGNYQLNSQLNPPGIAVLTPSGGCKPF